MKKILITGSSGLLGSNLVRLSTNSYEVVPTHSTHSLFENSIKMDITNWKEVRRVTGKAKPDVVVHTAAETGVDKCEIDRERAWKVNAEGTRNLAKACREINAKLVYVSTDYVFDGEKGLYVEEDATNPINYYGLTKLKGEEFVREICTDYVIARASVLYGWHPWKTNYATWVLNSLRRGEKITVVNDHYNSPTLANNLAEALLEMIEKDLSGLYHTAGSERINRYEFAVKIAKKFNLDLNLISPLKMTELKAWVAKRPKDSSLCITKAQKSLKTKFLNVHQSLVFMKKDERRQGHQF